MNQKPNRLAVALASLKQHPQRIDQIVTCNRTNAATLAAIPRSQPLTPQNGGKAS